MGWFGKNYDNQFRLIINNQQRIINLLRLILQGERKMSAELDALTAQVAENSSVEQSALILIQGLAQKIADAVANNDGPALTALSQQLHDSAAALAAAVAANTPTT